MINKQTNTQVIARLRLKVRHQVNRVQKDNRQTLLILQFFSSVLEYFDFFAFAYLAMYFIKFFPHDLLEIYGIALLSLVSFLFRPLGYRLYFYLAQRVPPLKLHTINSILISLAILSTGLMPLGSGRMKLVITLVFIGRAVYGVCFGIRLQGNLSFVKKNYPEKIHGTLFSSMIGAQVGLSCASFVNKILYNHLSPSLMDWGWRAPFFIGAIFSLILFIIRLVKNQPENKKAPVTNIKNQSIDEVAFKIGRKLWLSLLLSSTRACLMFNLFLSIPLMLNWSLDWTYGTITNIMFVATILNVGTSWYVRLRRVEIKNNQILITLIFTLIPLAILGFSIAYNYPICIISCIFILAIINGYLFLIIPKFIIKLFDVKSKPEAMIFISNFEFFHFNLLRRLLLVISLLWFGTILPQHYFLFVLILTMNMTFFTGIIAMLIIRHRNYFNETLKPIASILN